MKEARRARRYYAIQDQLPHNHCWGCGTENPLGLQIKSYPDGDETVCRFQPGPQHMAGPSQRRERRDHRGRDRLSLRVHGYRGTAAGPPAARWGRSSLLWSVTASLKIDYLAPTPIAEPMELRARIAEVKGRKRVVGRTVRARAAEECARAEGRSPSRSCFFLARRRVTAVAVSDAGSFVSAGAFALERQRGEETLLAPDLAVIGRLCEMRVWRREDAAGRSGSRRFRSVDSKNPSVDRQCQTSMPSCTRWRPRSPRLKRTR